MCVHKRHQLEVSVTIRMVLYPVVCFPLVLYRALCVLLCFLPKLLMN